MARQTVSYTIDREIVNEIKAIVNDPNQHEFDNSSDFVRTAIDTYLRIRKRRKHTKPLTKTSQTKQTAHPSTVFFDGKEHQIVHKA